MTWKVYEGHRKKGSNKNGKGGSGIYVQQGNTILGKTFRSLISTTERDHGNNVQPKDYPQTISSSLDVPNVNLTIDVTLFSLNLIIVKLKRFYFTLDYCLKLSTNVIFNQVETTTNSIL